MGGFILTKKMVNLLKFKKDLLNLKKMVNFFILVKKDLLNHFLQLKESDYVKIIAKEMKNIWKPIKYILDCIKKKQNKGLKTMTSFYNLRQEEPIFEQVLLFAGTLLPNEKIIVSFEDYRKIITAKDSYGYYLTERYLTYPFHVAGFDLQTELINNFPRAELGETRTNKNFELRK